MSSQRLIDALNKPCTETFPSGCLYEDVLIDAADANAAFEAARGDVAELNRERDGMTLVGAAVRFCDASLLERLIVAGADADTPLKVWGHPLQLAAGIGHLASRW